MSGTAQLVQPSLGVRPVRRAYEQAADQLRQLIITGELAPGSRLPTENDLARRFAISRSTMREALRLLAAQSLIRTEKGPTGGNFVTVPTIEHISEFLQATIGLLTETETVTLADFLEVRELVECRAVRLAAESRSEDDLRRLHASIPESPLELEGDGHRPYGADFHAVVVESCGNTLLRISCLPLFGILQANLTRAALRPVLAEEFYASINEQHSRIADAIAQNDSDRAEVEMREHLAYLRPYYERAWTHVGASRSKSA